MPQTRIIPISVEINNHNGHLEGTLMVGNTIVGFVGAGLLSPSVPKIIAEAEGALAQGLKSLILSGTESPNFSAVSNYVGDLDA